MNEECSISFNYNPRRGEPSVLILPDPLPVVGHSWVLRFAALWRISTGVTRGLFMYIFC